MHRLATLADLDAVYSIYMDKDVVPYLGFDPMPRDDFAKVLSDLIAGNSFYVVEVNGGVQGFYRASRHQGRARHGAYLGTFAVAPEARGTGLARSIVETAMSRLNAEGVTRIELTLEADNKRALSFYTKLGFELEGTMRSAYKRSSDSYYLDELLMAKLLPPVASHSEALQTWHQLVRSHDTAGLNTLLADDAVFYSPVVHTPQRGKKLAAMYLSAAFQVFFNPSFRYVREIVGESDAMLEFETEIDGIRVNGVDLIKWNNVGQIVEFKVMLRPLKAINLIHQRMAAMLQPG